MNTRLEVVIQGNDAAGPQGHGTPSHTAQSVGCVISRIILPQDMSFSLPLQKRHAPHTTPQRSTSWAVATVKVANAQFRLWRLRTRDRAERTRPRLPVIGNSPRLRRILRLRRLAHRLRVTLLNRSLIPITSNLFFIVYIHPGCHFVTAAGLTRKSRSCTSTRIDILDHFTCRGRTSTWRTYWIC